ncbi:hypothetical protein CTEN210_05578 [Chaetoceros tenuissimus]|uniref:Uncharacterized protein n=1 Tax=Chaetoceros tenuissimus TaxID=426638 RepID=A0AAD3CNG0_9STRA|nr:hypothetical protein CTEN210_05578 [Chaetoceros tenuissimus]
MKFIQILFLIALCFASSNAFGIQKDAVKEASEETVQTQPETTAESKQEMTGLTEQDAVDIAGLIEAAGQDPETIKLIAALKEENAADIEELKKLPEVDILHGMKGALDEMKMLDVLFKDPVKAVDAFEAEGLLPPEHLEKYKKDPALLEDDTRKALYFRFVSLAVVGGYL